jgi:hypothetical protein
MDIFRNLAASALLRVFSIAYRICDSDMLSGSRPEPGMKTPFGITVRFVSVIDVVRGCVCQLLLVDCLHVVQVLQFCVLTFVFLQL